MKKKYRIGFEDGWLEAIGRINGDIELEKEKFTIKQYQLIKSILTKWMGEWKNLTKLYKLLVDYALGSTEIIDKNEL